MRNTLRSIALLAVFALVAAACGGDGGDTTTPEEFDHVPVKVGTLLPQTGGLAGIIDALEKPIEMAVAEINDAGGSVELLKADSGTDQNIASVNVDTLLNADVHAVIGAAASGVSLSVIDKLGASQVVQCSPSNTGVIFTTRPDSDYYFRTAPSDVLQGPALADVVAADDHNDVAIIYRNDEYGAGFNDEASAALRDAGLNVVASVAYDPEATSWDAEVGQVAAANPDAVIAVTFGEGVGVMQAMIQAGVGPDSVPIYVTDGFADSVSAIDIDPDNPGVLVGVKGTAPSAAPASGEPTFASRFEAFAPGTPTIFSAHSYDCLMVIVLAAQVAGSAENLVDAMVSVTRDGTKCTTYEACVALIADGQDIDYDGASGPLDFTSVGEPSVGTYDIFAYDETGGRVTLDQVDIGG